MFKNRFLRIALTVLLSVFLIHQLYSVFYNPIKTISAEYISETEGIPFTGMIIRNEIVIDRHSGGVMHLMINDGERVSKNGTIADIYTSEKDSLTVNKINDLKKQIKDIETIKSYNDIAAINIELLDYKISETLSNMLYYSGNGDYKGAREDSDELLMMMNRKEMIIGSYTDFSSQLTNLNNQLASLQSQLSQPVDKIKAVSSGFFVSQVDGYENVLKTDNLDSFTPEFMEKVTAESVDSSSKTGKIVSDYTWYIAANISVDDSLSYKEGDSVKIKTNLKSNPLIKVKVAKINLSKDRKKAVILFSCQEMNSELAAMRSAPMTIINGEYEGLKIDSTALRVNENQTGVYIVSGMELKFVKVKVLYQKDDYVICEKSQANDNTSLRLYDKVVVKGKNLYEGKIID